MRLALWDGFLWKVRPPEKVAEWKAREAELQDAARRQLAEMRLFVADIESPSKPMGVGQGLGRAEAACGNDLRRRS